MLHLNIINVYCLNESYWGSFFIEPLSCMYIEQVASRTVSLVAGCIFMIMGCIGKVAALFVTIPEPVLGGLFHVTLGKTYGLEE